VRPDAQPEAVDRDKVLFTGSKSHENTLELTQAMAFGMGKMNFIVGDKALPWSPQLGGYEGILKSLDPKPDFPILGVFGLANLDGRPFGGSLAEFARNVVQWPATDSQSRNQALLTRL